MPFDREELIVNDTDKCMPARAVLGEGLSLLPVANTSFLIFHV